MLNFNPKIIFVKISPVNRLDWDAEKEKEIEKFIPLNFWFNRTTGLALPMTALNFEQVQFKVEFNKMIDVD